MNDKIKEVAAQIEHWEIYDNGGKPIVYDNKPYGAASHMEFSSIQKFAELIVRECAKVVSEKTGPRSALNVLEHFGFEE